MGLQGKLRPAIFLDRDGTINREVNYLSEPGEFELLPGAAKTIARLNTLGWAVVLVTNQSGVGRGYFSIETLGAIHALMRDQLRAEGARLDGIYVCPHHPDLGCLCRKPETQLYQRAADDLSLDLSRSYFIGDKLSDILPARKFGAQAILVSTGHGESHLAEARRLEGLAVAFAADLPAAARYINRGVE